VGPAAAGVLGTTSLGPRLPILVAAAFSLVTTVAIVAGLKTPPPCPEGAPSPSVTEAGLCQQAKPAKDAALTTEVAPLFKAPAVFRVVVACFAIFLAFNLFYAGFPLHAATAYGWDTGRLGLFFAMLSGFMIVAQGPVLRFVAQRFPPPVAFALGMASLAASMVLLAVPLPFFAAGFFALGNGLAWPTFQTRIAEVAPDQQGEVQGMTTSAGSMASILGLLLGGALYPGLGVGLFLGSGVVFFVVLSLTPLWFSSSEPPST
ncbi:MAG: MFS transporter, partial [Myxococcota bacterium]